MQAAIDTGEARSDPRSNVFLLATLCAGAASNPVKVRNLSARGALLEGSSLPPAGASACLRRGSLQASGVIAWQSTTHCGMHFDGGIEVEKWVQRVGTPGQQQIDAAIAGIRAGAPAKQPPELFPGRDRGNLLASASAELLQICERLASMPGMSVELAEELVKLDSLAHSLRTAR